MKRAFLLILLPLIVACNSRTSSNNKHSAPADPVVPVEAHQDSSFVVNFLAFKKTNNYSSASVKRFFDENINVELMRSISLQKSPKELNALSGFFRIAIETSRTTDENRQVLRGVAKNYLDILYAGCEGSYSSCQLLGPLYSAYAADFLLLAEPLVSEPQEEFFVTLLSHVGNPANNTQARQQKINYLLERVIADKMQNAQDLLELKNMIIFSKSSSSDAKRATIVKLLDSVNLKNLSEAARVSVEQLILFSARRDSRTVDLKNEHLLKYLEVQIKDNGVYKFMNLPLRSSFLLNWKEDEKFILAEKENWVLHYSLIALVLDETKGELKKEILQKFVSTRENKNKLIKFSETFLYKKFIENVYKSHIELGKIFQRNLSKSQKIESFFFEFFDEGDVKLTEIWINSFAHQANTVEKFFVSQASESQIENIRKFKTQLLKNVRAYVTDPSIFLMGFHLLAQGNFNFARELSGNKIENFNQDLYFRNLFEGKFPSMYRFLDSLKNSSSQDQMKAFYFSLDKEILAHYDIDYSFTDNFVTQFFKRDLKVFEKYERQLAYALSEGSLVSRFLKECEWLKEGNYSFSIERKFSLVDRAFYRGPLGFRLTTNTNVGTTKELSNYIAVYASNHLSKNLSEKIEFLRIDLGSKLKVLKIFEKSMARQGHKAQVIVLRKHIEKLEAKIEVFFVKMSNNFVPYANCASQIEKTEFRMQKVFFQRELEYIRSTYQALRLLRRYEGSEIPDIQILRQRHSSSFEFEYLKQLPQQGDFLRGLNDVWQQINSRYTNNVRGYKNRVLRNAGFKLSDSGSYAFLTSKLEDKFRKVVLMEDSRAQGIDFPGLRVTEVPATYDVLISHYNATFPNPKDITSHAYKWEVNDIINTEDEFVRHHFNLAHKSTDGNLTTYRHHERFYTWKSLLLQIAAITKFRGYLATKENRDYSSYKEQLANIVKDDFDFAYELTQDLLASMYIDEEDEKILTAIGATDYSRERSVFPGKNFFVYYPLSSIEDVGQFDYFFSVLSSYSLGFQTVFRTSLFGNASNPLVSNWNTKVINPYAPSDLDTYRKTTKVIESEEALQRRSLRYFALKNAISVYRSDETFIFQYEPDVMGLIRHDFYHAITADFALSEAFIDWTKALDESGVEKIPYRFNLHHHSQANTNPDYLQPSVIQRYWETRQAFDDLSHGLFVF